MKLEHLELMSLTEAYKIGYRYLIRTKKGKVMLLRSMHLIDTDTWYYDHDDENYAILLENRFTGVLDGKAYTLKDIIAQSTNK